MIEISNPSISQKCGKKAESLMILKNNGYHVPDGFILDFDVYHEIVAFNQKKEEMDTLLSKVDSENFIDYSKSLSSLIHAFTFPDKLAMKICKRINEDKKYAVRSSGSREDTSNLSFAGQYDTFLNVSGTDAILEAILRCYASMYSGSILPYFMNHRIPLSDLEMAVIIEEMVDAEKSGIIFTINPKTGNDKEIVIEVASGLGENIVSGKVIPENYTYNWFYNVPYYDGQNQLLTEQELSSLTDTALSIQMHFGYPCDIEFAFHKGTLYILQSRAITKIMYSEIYDQWTTADFKDGGISATVCTPYMWSLYEYIWEIVFRKFLVEGKMLKEKELGKLGDMFFGRGYWNLSVTKRAMAKVPGYKERDFDESLGVKVTYEGDGQTTKITLQSILNILPLAYAQNKILRKRKSQIYDLQEKLLQKYEAYLSLRNQDYDKTEWESLWMNLTKDDYLLSEGTYFWQIFINTVHQSLYKDRLMKHINDADYLNLLSGLDNVSHLIPFCKMWEISRKIIKDKNAFAFWSQSPVAKIKKEYEEGHRFHFLSDFANHIAEYGYHSDKELDVTYPCYFEDCESVIKQMKDMLKLSDKDGPESIHKKQKKRYESVLESVKKNSNPMRYKKFYKAANEMRNLLWWREEFRDISTKFYYLIRMYTLKLAKHYHEVGILSTPDDIWYLKVSDVWDYIDKKVGINKIHKIVERNKKYYKSFRNYSSENEIGQAFEHPIEEISTISDVIIGIGCNNGTVVGTAKVIVSLSDIDRLKKDDILVTKFTDTGWTSKFALLKGVVTEYGGMLCHAAIVSREYGIPCVVAAKDVLERIKDGDRILVNGTSGEIKKLDGCESGD